MASSWRWAVEMGARHGEVARVGSLIVLLLAGGVAAAAAPPDEEAAANHGGAAPWEGRASLAAYFLPDESNYLIPIAAVDHGGLHLEARYNYEDRRTGTVFAGWNFEFGGAVEGAVTPMLGAVLGRTNGVAPGRELTLGWGPLEYYHETEVVFDLGNSANSYFYAWAELSAAATEWFRAGVALQRMRVFQSSRELTPGPFVRFSVSRFELSAYWFAPGADDQYAAVSLGVQF